jgi:small Trp-rich protein
MRGLVHLLTLLLTALKLIGVAPVAEWTWFWVLSPSIFTFGFVIFLFGLAGLIKHLAERP